jgi:archaetidylinositol phosphate synthase
MSHNTWLHRIAEVGVNPLVATRIRPNHITVGRLLTGLGAAILFGIGTRETEFWGAGLYLLSMLLDRADGILARKQGTMSRAGHVFDLVADAVCTTIVFIGIGVGLRETWLGEVSYLLGAAAGTAVAFSFWMSMRLEAVAGTQALGLSSAGGFDPDDAMLAVPIVCALGFAQYLLLAAAGIAPIFALLLLYLRWKALKVVA